MDAQERTDQLFKILYHLKKARTFIPEVPGVPQGEFMMLHRIYCCMQEEQPVGELPGVKVSRLSNYMGMSLPAVSQMLKALQKKGLVTRTVATDDRRVVYVTLTPVGVDLFSQAMEAFVRQISQAAELFGEDKIRDFNTLLDDLGQAMEQVKAEQSK